MEQDIETLIEHAIANTQVYVSAPGGDSGIARTGLERIFADLAGRAPDHPALTRLAAFIEGLRQRAR
jgi:hypothetical protein